jgi:hypothetical protein
MDSGMKTQSWALSSLLGAALLFAGGAAHSQPVKAPAASPTELKQRAEALTREQIEQSHDVASLTRLALVYAKMGDKTRAYDTLMRMQIQGFGYDISKDSRFDPVHGTKVWDYLVANLGVNSKSFGEGKVVFDLPKSDNLMNALAWDAKRKTLLVGSARDGSIHRLDEKGKLTDFIAAGSNANLWGVDALGVDAAHDKLYVATSASPKFAKFSADNANKAALLEFDLNSGKFVKKYAAPSEATHTFNDIAVSDNGAVYVADGVHRVVYKVEGNTLKPVVQNPKLTAISAITVSANGRVLYIADYALGIFGFDLSKGQAFEPAYNPDSLVLGGIVGMHFYEDTLVIIEDGMVPKRVMRLALSPDGHTIKGAMPLDVASQDFIALGDGTLAGDKLYFITNRQDSLYDRNGVLTSPSDAEPEAVFASNVRFAWGKVGAAAMAVPAQLGLPKDAKKEPGASGAPTKENKH